MSNITTKITRSWITVIVLAIIVIILWIISSNSQSDNYHQVPPQNPQAGTVETTPQQNVANVVPSSQVDSGLTTSPADSSNTALQSDLNSVDSMIGGLSSDTTSVGQSVTNSATQTP